MDTSGKIHEAGPAQPNITSFDSFYGCFGGGPGLLPNNNGTFDLDTGEMMPNNGYEFRLEVTKDTRSDVKSKYIHVIPPEAPNITIE